jgi:ribosomal protein L33
MRTENLLRLRCEKCGEEFYLVKKIWLRKDELSFCKFCGAEGIMRELFKMVLKDIGKGEGKK